MTATLRSWEARWAQNARIQQQYQQLASLSKLATLSLIVSMLLSLTMALVVHPALKTGQHACEVARAHGAIQKEVHLGGAAQAGPSVQICHSRQGRGTIDDGRSGCLQVGIVG